MPFKDKARKSAHQAERVKKRRQQWLLENGPCAYCRSWERLEVDHKDFKEKTSHRIWSWAEARRLEELKKCQVLCHDCHVEKSRTEKLRGENHQSAKLTDAELQEIQEAHKQGCSTKELAILHAIHIRTVQCIVYGSGSTKRYQGGVVQQ